MKLPESNKVFNVFTNRFCHLPEYLSILSFYRSMTFPVNPEGQVTVPLQTGTSKEAK